MSREEITVQAMQEKPRPETSDPPESGIVSRPSLAEPVRDTIVEAPPRWLRFRALITGFCDAMLELLRDPRLSDRLPPIPQPGQIAAHELVLLDIMRAPLQYQKAAVDVARYAVELRRLGENAYAEGLVHFALSRMRPDKNGSIAFVRLRDMLSGVPVSGVLVPALRRLEGHGIVSLVSTSSEQQTSMGFNAVELHIPL